MPEGCGGKVAVRTFRVDADTIELSTPTGAIMRRVRCDGATGAARAAACQTRFARSANLPSPHIDTRDVVRRPGNPVRIYLFH